MSAVRPRPVGPTMRGKALAATMPSRPRRRRHVSPNETISIAANCQAKETRGACPIGAPRFEGGRGNEKRCFTVPLTRRLGMEREATSLQMVKKQISKDLVHNSAMSPTRQSTSVRAALAALTLALVTGCVSVSPPPPTPPPTNAPSQAPTTSAPRTLEPTLAPTPSSPSDSAAPTTSPDSSEGPATPGATVDPALAEQIDAVNAQVPPIRQLE